MAKDKPAFHQSHPTTLPPASDIQTNKITRYVQDLARAKHIKSWATLVVDCITDFYPPCSVAVVGYNRTGKLVLFNGSEDILQQDESAKLIDAVKENQIDSLDFRGRRYKIWPLEYEDNLYGGIAVADFPEEANEVLGALVAQATSSFRAIRLSEGVRDSARETRAMLNLSRAIADGSKPFKMLAERVIEEARTALGVPAVALYLYNAKNRLELQSHLGLSDINEFRILPESTPLLDKIKKTKDSLQVREIQGTHRAEVLRAQGFHSMAVAPLMEGEGIDGVLVILTNRPWIFSFAQMRLLRLLAEQAAIALGASRLSQSNAQAKNEVDQVRDSMQDGLVIVNQEGVIRYFNDAAHRLLGTTKKVLNTNLVEIADNFTDYAGTESHLQVFGDLVEALEQAGDGRSRRVQIQVITPAGRRVLEGVIGPYYGVTDEVIGSLISLRDMTEIYSEREKLAIIQESHSIGMVVLDAENRIMSLYSRWPEFNESFIGQNYLEVMNQPPISDLFIYDMEVSEVLDMVRRGREITFYAEARVSGRVSHLQLVATQMQNTLTGGDILITTRDVTVLVEKTIEANEMARLAGRHSRELTTLSELSGFVGFRFDQIYRKYLEVTMSLLGSPSVSIYLYSPSDQLLKRVATSTAMNEHEPTHTLDGPSLVARSYISRSDLTERAGEATGQMFPGNAMAVPIAYHSKVLGAILVSHRDQEYGSHDIKLLKLIASRLAVIVENAELYNEVNSRRERWEAVFQFAEEGIVIFDKNGRIVGFNPAACKLTGFNSGEVVGRLFTDVVRTISPEGFNLSALSPIKHVLGEGEVVTKREALLQAKNGQHIWTEISYSPIFDSAGVVISGIAVISNVQKEREIEAVKSDFISIVSHELRTPLSAIKGFLSMLIKKDFGELSEKQFHFLTRVYQTNQRMINLVEDLLDASYIESGKIRLKVAPLAVEPLISDVVSELASKGFERQIMIKINRRQKLPLVLADETRLRQILLNLVDNAIKYSLPKSEVNIDFKVQGNELVTSITDQGVGITAANVDQLFQKFGRIYNPMSMQAGGSGLGLYIVKNLVESHGGRIWATSREHKGSKFSFTMPIAKQLPLLQ
ncbi:MAG TPA: ATP-binding protein [Candidatus Saccharimonadales bacterium]|nr:ATP-binding protein [Candidatus Saccharimonadales bacterium]